MKRLVAVAVLFVTLSLSFQARANAKEATITAGRLSVIQACFIVLTLKTVEQNMFNGQEKVNVDATAVATFAPLMAKTTTLKAGDNVLVGSPKFASETGITPDVSMTDANCELVKPSAKIAYVGSFGPVGGEITLPSDFATMSVFAQTLIALQSTSFIVKWLGGEKSIGGAGTTSGGSSSGGSSSGGSSSGGSSSGGTGTSGGTSGTTAPASSSDSSCSIGRVGGQGPRGLAATALLALVVLGARRRRASACAAAGTSTR